MKRSCHCCGHAYDYPKPSSQATRMHCERCAGLDPATREVFNVLHREIVQLRKQIELLKKEDSKS